MLPTVVGESQRRISSGAIELCYTCQCASSLQQTADRLKPYDNFSFDLKDNVGLVESTMAQDNVLLLLCGVAVRTPLRVWSAWQNRRAIVGGVIAT